MSVPHGSLNLSMDIKVRGGCVDILCPFEIIIIIQCTQLHKRDNTVHSKDLAVAFPGEPLSNPSPGLHSTLHLHSTLSHALHAHYNPWLISSVNQWDSVVTATKVARQWLRKSTAS